MAEYVVYLRCVVENAASANDAQEMVLAACDDVPAEVYAEKVVARLPSLASPRTDQPKEDR